MVELRYERRESTGDAVNRLHRKPTHYKQKQEKSGDTIAENKHRKEEKQKTIFSFPQKKFRGMKWSELS